MVHDKYEELSILGSCVLLLGPTKTVAKEKRDTNSPSFVSFHLLFPRFAIASYGHYRKLQNIS